MLNFCLDIKDIKYVVIAWLIPSSTVNTSIKIKMLLQNVLHPKCVP